MPTLMYMPDEAATMISETLSMDLESGNLDSEIREDLANALDTTERFYTTLTAGEVMLALKQFVENKNKVELSETLALTERVKELRRKLDGT